MEEAKLKSRKFAVWITWLVITVVILAYCIIIAFVSKEMITSAVTLLEKVLSWFFAVSMMYLGMNVGQKVGLSVAENILGKKEEKEQ